MWAMKEMGTSNRPTDGVKGGGMRGELIKATGEACHGFRRSGGRTNKRVAPAKWCNQPGSRLAPVGGQNVKRRPQDMRRYKVLN